MRKVLISLLLASVAVSPAMAARDDASDRREERREAREDRREAREERRDVREQRAEPQREVRVRSNDGGNRPALVERSSRPNFDNVREAREARRTAVQSNREQRIENRQDLREQRRVNRELRQSERAVPPVLRDRAPVISRAPREGTQPPLRAERRRSPAVQWSTSHWRNDRRYDWRNWRNRHRSLFRLGLYIDPFNWGYRPYSIGWRMWPSHYSSNYWLNDPWQYRLPYAPPGYRWVRYWDDAVLVDTWDGRVVDVIHNFFW